MLIATAASMVSPSSYRPIRISGRIFRVFGADLLILSNHTWLDVNSEHPRVSPCNPYITLHPLVSISFLFRRTPSLRSCTKSAAKRSAAYDFGDSPMWRLRLSQQLPCMEKNHGSVVLSFETLLMYSATSNRAKYVVASFSMPQWVVSSRAMVGSRVCMVPWFYNKMVSGGPF